MHAFRVATVLTVLTIAASAATPAATRPAHAQSPQTAPEWVARGRALLDSGKNDDAVKAFERAVKLEPQSSANHLWLAQALGAVAERASVLRQPFIARRIKGELERARDLDPLSVDPRMGLINFYMRAPGVMGGSESKARAEAAEITRTSPMRGAIARAQIALMKKDTATAEREYRDGAAAAPDSALAQTQLAGFLRRTRRDSAAYGVLEAFLTRRPDDPVALYAFGQFTAATGMHLERGEPAMRRYVSLPPDPDNRARPAPAVAHYWFGQLLAKKGDKPEARAQFDRALQLNPALTAAKRAREELRN